MCLTDIDQNMVMPISWVLFTIYKLTPAFGFLFTSEVQSQWVFHYVNPIKAIFFWKENIFYSNNFLVKFSKNRTFTQCDHSYTVCWFVTNFSARSIKIDLLWATITYLLLRLGIFLKLKIVYIWQQQWSAIIIPNINFETLFLSL